MSGALLFLVLQKKFASSYLELRPDRTFALQVLRQLDRLNIQTSRKARLSSVFALLSRFSQPEREKQLERFEMRVKLGGLHRPLRSF